MFSKPLSPFEQPKRNKSVFQSKAEHLLCFELNYKFLERHKKPLSLATTRKQENPVNTAQKMATKSSTKQDGESARVDCHVYIGVRAIFCRGGGDHLPKNIFASCPNFTKHSKRNEAHTTQQHTSYWLMNLTRYSFSGSIPPKIIEHK